jgi:hypothetical protein
LSYRGKSLDPAFGQPAEGTSQAPRTIKVPSASTMRACRFGRIATMPSIRDNGIKLKAVDRRPAQISDDLGSHHQNRGRYLIVDTEAGKPGVVDEWTISNAIPVADLLK